ncbi:unnamed protein product [Peronospora farinosa]|uniref:Uncharacterized protein n=1 Tax=Peronospora farinosa TaxID=134698 RepID=A0AAV0UFS5_9STRA|nr:unnamed protein product [Peronospora farinosa]
MTKYHIFGVLWIYSVAIISLFDTRYALFGFGWLSSSGDIVDRSEKRTEGANKTLTAGDFFVLCIIVVYCISRIAIVRTLVKELPDPFRTRKRISNTMWVAILDTGL